LGSQGPGFLSPPQHAGAALIFQILRLTYRQGTLARLSQTANAIEECSMQHRPLNTIAAEIKSDWRTRLNGAAVPYIEGLSELRDPRDQWFRETGADAIRGFLNNAQSWRGDVARRVKAELRAILKEHEAI